jgi:hypothetical protein
VKTDPTDPRRAARAERMTRLAGIASGLFYFIIGLSGEEGPAPIFEWLNGLLVVAFFLWMASGLKRSRMKYVTGAVGALYMVTMSSLDIGHDLRTLPISVLDTVADVLHLLLFVTLLVFLFAARRAIPVPPNVEEGRGFEVIVREKV